MNIAGQEYPDEPTSEQCSGRVRVPDFGGRTAFACWYPQMGGYVGKCVVVISPTSDGGHDDGCFDAYVWHDGEFPFSGSAHSIRPDGVPICVHHCSATQFIEFGSDVSQLITAARSSEGHT